MAFVNLPGSIAEQRARTDPQADARDAPAADPLPGRADPGRAGAGAGDAGPGVRRRGRVPHGVPAAVHVGGDPAHVRPGDRLLRGVRPGPGLAGRRAAGGHRRRAVHPAPAVVHLRHLHPDRGDAHGPQRDRLDLPAAPRGPRRGHRHQRGSAGRRLLGQSGACSCCGPGSGCWWRGGSSTGSRGRRAPRAESGPPSGLPSGDGLRRSPAAHRRHAHRSPAEGGAGVRHQARQHDRRRDRLPRAAPLLLRQRRTAGQRDRVLPVPVAVRPAGVRVRDHRGPRCRPAVHDDDRGPEQRLPRRRRRRGDRSGEAEVRRAHGRDHRPGRAALLDPGGRERREQLDAPDLRGAPGPAEAS